MRTYSFKACSADGCDKNVHPRGAKGYCPPHYMRFKRHGDPHAGLPTTKGEPASFVENVAIPYRGGDCLIWPYGKTGNGYGRFDLNGQKKVVSRYVCERTNGAPPTPKHEAAHSCGNGRLGCVNPRHLSWKTSKQNKDDMLTHGTRVRGDRHSGTTTTEAQVKEILSLRGTKSQPEIARQVGVSRAVVNNIYQGRSWSWLAEATLNQRETANAQ